MDRWQWVDAFRNVNVNTAELMNMKEEDFMHYCEFLVNSGLAPASYLKPKKTKEEEELDRIIEESKKIKRMRDERGYSGYRFSSETCSNLSEQKFDMNNIEEDHHEEENKEKDLGPRSYVWNDDDANEANKVVMDQQEVEYNRLLKEQLEIQEEEKKNHIEEMKQNLEETNMSVDATQKKREAIERLQFLGPEPDNGTQLALQMPYNQRILRKFDVNDFADDVFTVVEGQEEMYDSNDFLQEYSITFGFNQNLVRGKTLRDQGITRKTLLNVMFS